MHRCGECGYDLRGLDRPRCPECGTPFQTYPAPKATSLHWLPFAIASILANALMISVSFFVLNSLGHIQDDLLLQPIEQLLFTFVLFAVTLLPSWIVIVIAPGVYRLLPASALLMLCIYQVLLGILYVVTILRTADWSILLLGNVPLATLPVAIGVLWDVRRKDRTE